MKKLTSLLASCLVFFAVLSPVVVYAATDSTTAVDTPQSQAAGANLSEDKCTKANLTTFFGLPPWYKYLYKDGCIQTKGVDVIWAIVLAVIEILLRVAVYISVAMVIWGGIKMIMSQGEPENFANARKTIINALIGLVITMVATGLVVFIGNQFKG